MGVSGVEGTTERTRFFYDTEFLEDGKTIDLISIGIVSESGATYYAVNRDANWDRIRADAWLMENVVPHLPPQETFKPKWQIANNVGNFLLRENAPELWAYYAAYDHVALAQLWGKMIDLPEGIPMWTNDFKQELERRGLADSKPEQTGTEHDALADAQHLKVMFDWALQVSS